MKRFPLVLYLILGSVGTTLAGFGLGGRWALPLLGAAVPYAVFLHFLLRKEPGRAFRWTLVWAVVQSLVLGVAIGIAPERAARVVFQGPAYAAEMLHWIRTGVGPEGDPSLFLPIHLRHFAGFCALSVVTFGAAALGLGTGLLNYMNYYVVTLIRESAHPGLAALIGWPPWAMFRVVGFVATGTALTSLALSLPGRMRRGEPVRVPWGLLGSGVALVVFDAVLKTVLAPTWREFLLRALLGTGI